MVKRAAPQEAPAPRPRKAPKKQAVTKTHKAMTIALIRQNASNSPLLTLPAEIRERILKYLLGDKLIHVSFLYTTSAMSLQPRDLINRGGSFCHTVCSAYSTGAFDHEQEAFGASGRHEMCKLHEKHWNDSHITRATTIIDPDFYQTITDGLSILSVSRQLYEEGNFILWSSNVLSFDRAESFVRFISTLNPAQKRNLKNIHLIINRTEGQSHGKTWKRAFHTKYLSMLRGIESLHLCIEHHYSDHRWMGFVQPTDDEIWRIVSTEFGLETLQTLSLKHAAVTIMDAKEELTGPSLPPGRFFASEPKLKYATELKAKLLNPRGADLQQAIDVPIKAAAAELARQKKAFLRGVAKQMLKTSRANAANLDFNAHELERQANALEQTFEANGDAKAGRRADRAWERAQRAREKAYQGAEAARTKRKSFEKRFAKAGTKRDTDREDGEEGDGPEDEGEEGDATDDEDEEREAE